ncbi:MAG: family 10 glycosylhydrolase [Phycisphaerae bacterium]|nr:family 10 glycosylhydrolase [Phycisphaerae bacterium]
MWYHTSYRRNLIDMHIPDWNEEFLSRFDPKTYVDMLELGRVDTAYIYCTSCLGLCYWPTKVGKMHAGLKGRDILAELFALCKQRGIQAVAYYNNWSRWAVENHPDWRFVSVDGRSTLEYLDKGHYGACCPNSPYRDFVVAQIRDLCSRYEFVGMWFDMGMWPFSVCYCPHCQARYEKEAGDGPLPRVQDWSDPRWRRFVEQRNGWLAEYTQLLTDTVKACNPALSVAHQGAGWTQGWVTGTCQGYFAAGDYAGGDFYGTFADHSMACKLLANLTPNKPFEYMTSRCPDLSEHTTLKPVEQLRTEIAITLAHNGAFFAIDAIDPRGTLDRRVYEMLGTLFAEVESYEPFLDRDNELCQDIAVYLNFESLTDWAASGKTVTEWIAPAPQLEDIRLLGRALTEGHVPFGWITDRNLGELDRHRVILVPDFVELTSREAKALRDFTHAGGAVVVFRGRRNLGPGADPQTRQILTDMLGVEHLGETADCATYVAPTEAGRPLLAEQSADYPLAVNGPHSKIHLTGDAETLATIVLPYTDLSDRNRFASAISNPPGVPTDLPAIVRARCGNGTAVFVSGQLERARFEPQRRTLIRLVRSLLGRPATFETDAPRAVELTALHNPARRRYTVCLVNQQETLPAVPVAPIHVTLCVGAQRVAQVLKMPERQTVAFEQRADAVRFATTQLDVFLMYQIELQE